MSPRALFLSALLVLPGAVCAAGDAAGAFAQWAQVLQTFVNERGQVDFQGLATDPESLNAFVAYVAAESPQSAPAAFPTTAHRLAYYINAYNALSMYNIIVSKIPPSLAGIRKVWFFWVKRFQIGGRSMSLYTLENDIIRPFGDERIHFALNCMTVSCPRLPRVPFATAMLNEQLDASTRAFFADPRNLQVDRVSRVIRASEILKFYQDDFLKRSPNLVGYVNRYLSDPIPEDFALEFIQYDWTVNVQNVKH